MCAALSGLVVRSTKASKLQSHPSIDSSCSTAFTHTESDKELSCLPLSDCEYADPSQTMLVFDWDDTLCPTTEFIDRWQVSCPAAGAYEPVDPERIQALQRWQEALRRLLERACAMSDHCVIVTNSRRPWVTDCVSRFAPGLLEIFTREHRAPRVVYAGECIKSSRCLRAQAMNLHPVEYIVQERTPEKQESECVLAKYAAMKREVKQFYSRYAEQSWKNVISIGDMTFERDALQELAFRRAPSRPEKLRTKAVVEPTESTITGLTLRLRYTTALLPAYIQFDGDLNIELDEAGDEAPTVLAEALNLPGLEELPLSAHAWDFGPAPSHFEAEMSTEELDFFVHTQVFA